VSVPQEQLLALHEEHEQGEHEQEVIWALDMAHLEFT
jgi:hypothetical protein